MSDRFTSESGVSLGRTRRRRFSPADPTKIDRLPPHSTEAEQGVLGCIMLEPRDCLGECVEKIKAGAEVFYELRHQTIYQALVEMFDQKVPIDVITLQQKLKDKQQLDQVGGLAYLSSLSDAVPSAANLSYYLEIVQEKFVLRKMIQTCTDVVARAYEHEGEVDQLLDGVETDILKIVESRVEETDKSMRKLVQGAIALVEDCFNRKGLSGISSGFPDLDGYTNGFQNGDMIVIAARPSMGKTSLALNIAEHAALEAKLPVGVFSLEMTAQSLVLRTLCSHSRVNLRSIRDGFMSERDFPKLVVATKKLSDAPLFIDDTAGLSILQLRAKARRMHQQHGIKLFVIDYLQLLHSTAARSRENRQQEIADISSGIKALAKELNVPIIVLSQLNRELERDKSRKPRLSDLRESGSIEQDADFVGLLYKPTSKDGEDEQDQASENDAIAVNLLIAKQRNGPTGDVPLTFLKGITRFESAAKVASEDVPPA